MALANEKCVPCEGGALPMTETEARGHLQEVRGWALKDGRLEKDFKFKDFAEAMRFINKVADVAEAEGHHPDIHISYNKVNIVLWTHAIKGLSRSDFILAAKIDTIA